MISWKGCVKLRCDTSVLCYLCLCNSFYFCFAWLRKKKSRLNLEIRIASLHSSLVVIDMWKTAFHTNLCLEDWWQILCPYRQLALVKKVSADRTNISFSGFVSEWKGQFRIFEILTKSGVHKQLQFQCLVLRSVLFITYYGLKTALWPGFFPGQFSITSA